MDGVFPAACGAANGALPDWFCVWADLRGTIPPMILAPRRGPASELLLWLNGGLVLSFLCGLLFFALQRSRYDWQWESVWEYRAVFLQGWLVTLGVSAVALAASVAFGVGAALARRSRLLPLRAASHLYVELIRGTPLLIQILILFYIVGDAFGLRDRYAAGVLALALFAGAYIGEIVRAGIDSVGASQRESALAAGFTTIQTYRYIVFPQAIRQVLPPLAGQFASLIKDSSLLSVVAVSEFAFNAQNVAATTYSTLESYVPLAVGYLILTLPISFLARGLERRFRYET